MDQETLERYVSKIAFAEGSDCWYWKGYVGRSGYGFFRCNLSNYAHRVSYEWFVGSIPEGLQVDHLCRVRNCVNPDHLEAVTRKENILRGISASALNAQKTNCKRNHPLTEENTYVRPNGARNCKVCRLEKQRKYRLDNLEHYRELGRIRNRRWAQKQKDE